MALAALTLLAPLLADLAQAVLGAILVVAAIGLVQLAPLRRIRAIRRRDFWLGLVALGSVLVVGVLRGVLGAVLISLLVLLHELNHPRIVAGHPTPGLLVIRPEARLYFANVRNVCDRIAALIAAERPPPRVVLLDLASANDVEFTALERLGELAEDLHGRGMALWLAVPSQGPQEVIGRAAQLLGRTELTTAGPLGVRIFPRREDAVAAFEGQAQPGQGR